MGYSGCQSGWEGGGLRSRRRAGSQGEGGACVHSVSSLEQRCCFILLPKCVVLGRHPIHQPSSSFSRASPPQQRGASTLPFLASHTSASLTYTQVSFLILCERDLWNLRPHHWVSFIFMFFRTVILYFFIFFFPLVFLGCIPPTSTSSYGGCLKKDKHREESSKAGCPNWICFVSISVSPSAVWCSSGKWSFGSAASWMG